MKNKKNVKKVYTTRMTEKQKDRLIKRARQLKMTVGDTIEHLLDIDKKQVSMIEAMEKRLNNIEKELNRVQ